MYKVGEYVVYNKNVCKIGAIKENYLQGKDYYLLKPITDESLKIDVPVDCLYLRDLITKEEISKIIEMIPTIEASKTNNKYMDNEYKNLMNSGKHEDFIKVIKTAYLKNKERTDNKKKIGDRDDNYFRLAEKYLYNEIAIVLGLSYNEAKEYVIREVEKLK